MLTLKDGELSKLQQSLSNLSQPGADMWFAEEKILLPRERAEELQNKISVGWNALTNVELWTAFHSLIGSVFLKCRNAQCIR